MARLRLFKEHLGRVQNMICTAQKHMESNRYSIEYIYNKCWALKIASVSEMSQQAVNCDLT